MKHLTTTQVAALIEAAEGDRNKLLFRLTYEHGLRISECLGLTRGHVRRGFLMIRGKKKGSAQTNDSALKRCACSSR